MKFKKQVLMEVAVGIFSFAMILVLLALTTVLSQELLFRRYYTLEVAFDSVADLGAGHAVMVRGVHVGKVKEINLRDQRVHVVARLDQPLELHEGYHIEVKTGSLIGGNVVNIFEGDPSAPLLPPDTIFRGHAPVELMSVAAETVQQIQATLNDGVLADLQTAVANIRRITQNLSGGDGTLGRLLEDGVLAGDIGEIAANIRGITAAIAQGDGTLGRLMMNDEIYKEVQAITANFNGISGRLAQGESSLGRLLNGDDQLYQDLAATMAQVRALAEGIGRGEGTLGRLFADEALFLELQALLREGRAAVDDMRETSPITTFTSIFFGVF